MVYTVELTQLPSGPQAYQLSLLNHENQPIGYAMGEFRKYVVWYEGKPYFFLNDLVINDQAHQQPDFGSQLLQEVENFARRQGAYWIRGHVDPQSVSYTTAGADKRTLGKFLGKHGYGLKREIHDDSIRFWKPLHRASSLQSRTSMKK